MKQKPITLLQVYMFIAQFLFSTTVGFYLSSLVKIAGFSIWISILAGSMIGIGIIYLSYKLCMRRPERFLAYYGREIIGKWVHYPLMTLVIIFNLFTSALVFRQLIIFLVQNYLLETPYWAIALLFGLCISQGVRSGAATLFRSAQGLFWLSMLSSFSFPLFTSTQMHTEMAIGFLTNFDLSGTWKSTLTITSLFSELTFIIYIFPYVNQEKKMMKPIIWGVISGALITLVNVVSSILLFGTELTGNLSYPALEIIRFIRGSAFFENMDPLFIVFWLYSMFFKISMFLLTSVMGLAQMLGLKDHKPFAYTMTAAMIFIALYMNANSAQLSDLTTHAAPAASLFPSFVPVIYLIVDSIRSRRKGKQKTKKKAKA